MNKHTVITWNDIWAFIRILSLRNDGVSKKATKIITQICNDPSFKIIEEDYFNITLKTDELIIKLWNNNLFYGWLHNASIIYKSGLTDAWDYEMPSRLSSFKLYRLLIEKRPKMFSKEHKDNLIKEQKERIQLLMRKIIEE